jgi:hypothetical protein
LVLEVRVEDLFQGRDGMVYRMGGTIWLGGVYGNEGGCGVNRDEV